MTQEFCFTLWDGLRESRGCLNFPARKDSRKTDKLTSLNKFPKIINALEISKTHVCWRDGVGGNMALWIKIKNVVRNPQNPQNRCCRTLVNCLGWVYWFYLGFPEAVSSVSHWELAMGSFSHDLSHAGMLISVLLLFWSCPEYHPLDLQKEDSKLFT